MRREGACEEGGKWDATCEASRQPSVFMLTRRAAVFAAMRPPPCPRSPLWERSRTHSCGVAICPASQGNGLQ
jgi:hypothetical protein